VAVLIGADICVAVLAGTSVGCGVALAGGTRVGASAVVVGARASSAVAVVLGRGEARFGVAEGASIGVEAAASGVLIRGAGVGELVGVGALSGAGSGARIATGTIAGSIAVELLSRSAASTARGLGGGRNGRAPGAQAWYEALRRLSRLCWYSSPCGISTYSTSCPTRHVPIIASMTAAPIRIKSCRPLRRAREVCLVVVLVGIRAR
jgi:hypothetical protein